MSSSSEAKHQELLVFRLRAHGSVEDAAHAADLMGAASEIERLAEAVDVEQVAFFERLHRVVADAVGDFVMRETGCEASISATEPVMSEPMEPSGVRGGKFDIEFRAPGAMFVALDVTARRPGARRTYEAAPG